MTPATTPSRLNLKKDESLRIDWADGVHSVYPIAYLRWMCPCAQCREVRQTSAAKKKTSLTVLPASAAESVVAVSAELVGNYALRIEWSDQHGSGIYSFEYLRDIAK